MLIIGQWYTHIQHNSVDSDSTLSQLSKGTTIQNNGEIKIKIKTEGHAPKIFLKVYTCRNKKGWCGGEWRVKKEKKFKKFDILLSVSDYFK